MDFLSFVVGGRIFWFFGIRDWLFRLIVIYDVIYRRRLIATTVIIDVNQPLKTGPRTTRKERNAKREKPLQ